MKSEFIKYCKRCIMPETKPDFGIGDKGICSGCLYYENRSDVNWDNRRNELMRVWVIVEGRTAGWGKLCCVVFFN